MTKLASVSHTRWAMGLYPVGILEDKKFHVYYIPIKTGESKGGVS